MSNYKGSQVVAIVTSFWMLVILTCMPLLTHPLSRETFANLDWAETFAHGRLLDVIFPHMGRSILDYVSRNSEGAVRLFEPLKDSIAA